MISYLEFEKPIASLEQRIKEMRALESDDGVDVELSAEYLRVLSPSAEVQGHSRDQRVTVPGKIDVSITAIDPVGNYAVRLTFSDGHNTGIFSWSYLRRLGEEHEVLWGEYLNELAAKGLSRAQS
mgnify:CR=1 FL=1